MKGFTLFHHRVIRGRRVVLLQHPKEKWSLKVAEDHIIPLDGPNEWRQVRLIMRNLEKRI